MCAMHCEAKPVIDFYRLKKSSAGHGYDLYSKNDMACIVSGIGETSMAAATIQAASLFRHQPNLCWINLGIAGHNDFAIGTTVLVSKVTQAGNAGSIDPILPKQQLIETAALISQANENTRYHENALFDMEAYAFFSNIHRSASLPSCQSLKVIGDNKHNLPDRNKARISALIADNMPAIAEFALQLQHIAAQQDADIL